MRRWKATLCLMMEGGALRLRLFGLANWARRQAKRFAPLILAALIVVAVVTSFPAPALVVRHVAEVRQ